MKEPIWYERRLLVAHISDTNPHTHILRVDDGVSENRPTTLTNRSDSI